MSNICPNSPLQDGFKQIYNNHPVVRLLNGTQSAALVYDTWSADSKKTDCTFTVDSNLFINGESLRRGLTFSIKRSSLRMDQTRWNSETNTYECIDYVRFTFGNGGAKTAKMCGTFDDKTEMGSYLFFIDPSGEIKVHIFVNKSVPFDLNQRDAAIELAFTAYDRMLSILFFFDNFE